VYLYVDCVCLLVAYIFGTVFAYVLAICIFSPKLWVLEPITPFSLYLPLTSLVAYVSIVPNATYDYLCIEDEYLREPSSSIYCLAMFSNNLAEFSSDVPKLVYPEDLAEDQTIEEYCLNYNTTEERQACLEDLFDNISIDSHWENPSSDLEIPDDFLDYDEDDLYLHYEPSTLLDPSYDPILMMYKQVDKKVKPVSSTFPQDAQVLRQFPHDPLETMIPLTPHPPDFIPDGRLTIECMDSLELNPTKFLWPEEVKLFQAHNAPKSRCSSI
jgi:hypothetical protein